MLRAIAADLGLDLPTFDRCLADGRHEAAIRAGMDEARRQGITGTPAVVINGDLYPLGTVDQWAADLRAMLEAVMP